MGSPVKGLYLHWTLKRRAGMVLGKFGIGSWAHGAWWWAARFRCWLSYNTGRSDWFYSREECFLCGCSADDADYTFVRTGRRRARCQDDCEAM